MEYLPAEMEIVKFKPLNTMLSGWCQQVGVDCGADFGILPDPCDEDDDWGGM